MRREPWRARKKNIEINIRCVISDVVKNMWIVIVVSGFIAMGTYLFSEASYSDVYRTTATYAVTAKGSSVSIFNNLTTAKSIAEVMKDILSSSTLKKMIAQDLGVESVPGTIDVQIVPESTLMNVTVTASSPEMAFKIIKSAMEHYTEISDYVVSNAVLDEISAPYIPMSASSRFTGKEKMIKAFEYSFLLLIVLFSALSVMSDRIKNDKDAEKRLDANLFGVVPIEKKKRKNKKRKKSILITNMETSFYFVEQIKVIATKLEYALRKRNGNVVVFTSLLENEGKSTIVSNIALALAQRGKKVLVVDADLRKPAIYKVFEREKEPDDGGLADYIYEKKSLSEVISYEEDLNMYVVCGRKSYEKSTELLASEGYKKFIDSVKKKYDYIIIDSVPIAYTADVEVIAEEANTVLLVVRQNAAPAAMINDTIDDLSECKAELLGCILNMSNGNRAFGGDVFGYGGRYGKSDYAGYRRTRIDRGEV